LAYVVEVFAQGDLAADEFMSQVVVLLLQAHVSLLQTTVLPLSRGREESRRKRAGEERGVKEKESRREE